MHQGTVDSYLEDILMGAVDATADRQAREEVRQLADKINDVAYEMEDRSVPVPVRSTSSHALSWSVPVPVNFTSGSLHFRLILVPLNSTSGQCVLPPVDSTSGQ